MTRCQDCKNFTDDHRDPQVGYCSISHSEVTARIFKDRAECFQAKEKS
jgi:hypothetical protein